MNDNNEERKQESGKINYKKAFEFLMIAMVAKMLSPDENHSGYGDPDICINCMTQGRNFAYGDDGDKKLICDKCIYNFMAYGIKIEDEKEGQNGESIL